MVRPTRGDTLQNGETGVVKPYFGFTPPMDYLLCDGAAVSRATYANLFKTISINITGTTANGNATITGVASTSNIANGMPISGPGIQAGSVVQSFVTDTSITMNQTATAGATVAIVIAPCGVGDGSTTFNVPDMRGRVAVGRDNMTSAAGLINLVTTATTTAGSAVLTGIPSTANIATGMAVYGVNIPAGASVLTVDSASQVTLVSGTGVLAGTSVATRFGLIDGGRVGATGGSPVDVLTIGQMPAHSHSLNIAANTVTTTSPTGSAPATGGTPTAGYTASVGSGQAHPNIQPSIVCNYIIRT